MTSTPFADIPVRQASQATDIPMAVAAGRTLIAAGAVFAVANATQWAVLSGVGNLHPAVLSVTWPIAIGLFFYILRQLRAHGGEAARRTAVWSRFAILSQIGVAVALAALSAATGNWGLMMAMSAVGLSLYAAAWTVAAIRTRRVWIGGVALGCFSAAGGVVSLTGSPAQYLAYACGLAAFVLVPGLVLVFRGRI
jgi:hypothetical protein